MKYNYHVITAFHRWQNLDALVKMLEPLGVIWEPICDDVPESYEIIMPFGRIENLPAMTEILRPMGVEWHPIFDVGVRFDLPKEPWIHPFFCPPPYPGWSRPHFISNFWMDQNYANPGSRYLFINDDDSLEAGFFEKIDRAEGVDTIICSMKRGDNQPPTGPQYGTSTLVAAPGSVKPGHVAGEQLIVGARVLPLVRFGPSLFGDGEMVMRACCVSPPAFVPDAFILFNWLEPGRWNEVAEKLNQK